MGESIRPDDVIAPGDQGSVQLRKLAGDLVTTFPNLVKLLARLVRDPRVPRRSKMVVGAALAYVVSPLDLLPEFIPVVGFADDALLVAFALNHLVNVAGEEVVLEHWDGPRDLLEMIRSVLDVASDLVPVKVRKLFSRLSDS
jgi:uncharacterized membrane protein YkvA (DUF1232 family)